jgi:DNA (cytosine-5)-methyltransferase 1
MFSDVCEDLWGMGYRVEAGIFSAAEVGAPHLRKRLFVMANRDGAGFEGERSGRIPDGDAARGDDPDGRSRSAMAYREGDGWHEGRPESAWVERRSDASLGCGTVADSDKPRPQGRSGLEQEDKRRKTEAGLGSDASGCGGALADTGAVRVEPQRWHGKSWPDSPFPPGPGDAEGWARMPDDAQPAVRRTPHGVPARVDRLRCLGNAVVSQVAALAWRTLCGRFGG